MSFSSGWGYAGKKDDQDPSFLSGGLTPSERRLMRGKIFSPKCTEMRAIRMKIIGDYESCSTMVASRYVIQKVNAMAFPQLDEPRGLILLYQQDDTPQKVIDAVQNIGLDLVTVGETQNAELHMESALLFALIDHFLSESQGWFQITQKSRSGSGEQEQTLYLLAKKIQQEGLHEVTSSSHYYDCDVIQLESLSLAAAPSADDMREPRDIVITYTTKVCRILSPKDILAKSAIILSDLINELQKCSDNIYSQLSSIKAINRLREDPSTTLQGLHDGDRYELSVNANTTSINVDNLSTPLIQRERERGYLLFLPKNATEFKRYWSLRCGYGLDSFDILSTDTSIFCETSSQDSMDSLDAEVTSISIATNNLLRVAPVPDLCDLANTAIYQQASVVLPASTICAGVIEVPYLSRSRSRVSNEAMYATLSAWSLIQSVQEISLTQVGSTTRTPLPFVSARSLS
jgi:hypothetical protein